MIIILKKSVTEHQIKHVKDAAVERGFKVHSSKGKEKTILGLIGDERQLDKKQFLAMPGVENVLEVLKPYKLASREFHPHDSVIDIDGIKVGGKELTLIAGPCSVESEKQIVAIAKELKKQGVKILRGGAFKPRTSPYAFQGHGEEGLKMLAKAREVTGMKIATEVMDPHEVGLVAEYADILQIGTRNMQNYRLLKAVGKTKKPVILKRGMVSTYKELLLAAEYIMVNGSKKVILCERGLRNFETYTRNTLDIAAVPALKELSHLPVIIDPSHGTGRRSLVGSMCKAAVAAGADGLIIETHTNPEKSISDADQTISTKYFAKLIKELRPIAKAVGRIIR